MKKQFALPEWIDRETWNEYEKMRRSIRKPMTDRARKIAVTRLEQFRRIGCEANEVLEQSIFMSWQGLFEVHEVMNAKRPHILAGSGPSDGATFKVKEEAIERERQRQMAHSGVH